MAAISEQALPQMHAGAREDEPFTAEEDEAIGTHATTQKATGAKPRVVERRAGDTRSALTLSQTSLSPCDGLSGVNGQGREPREVSAGGRHCTYVYTHASGIRRARRSSLPPMYMSHGREGCAATPEACKLVIG